MRTTTIALLFVCAAAPALAAERPNIILIVTDDQGWYELGCHGNNDIATPVLDRLAAEGTEFTRFYSCPVCAPTRAVLMTGRYYQRTGAIDTYKGRDTLSADEITLAQLLQKGGYRTAHVGKWHLGRYARYHPNSRGFDEFFGFWQYGFINRYDDSDELFLNREPIVTTGYITDVLTDAAIRVVRQGGDQPFFLYLCYNAPHFPNLAPDSYIQAYLAKGLPLDTARIYAMITCVDENIGRLLRAVDDAGLTRNTVVVFMSDNGGVSKHFKAGLRGFKGSVYEGGIRVPFIARWPGQFPSGKIPVPAQNIDVMPTICALAGVPLPGDRTIDGVSLLPLLRNHDGPPPHEFLFHQWNRVRPSPDESWAVHHGKWKLANGELFDLEADPGEQRDLAAQQPETTRRLRKAFLEWFADVTAGQSFERVAIEVGRDDENPIEIDVTWAEVTGKINPNYRHYNRCTLENWTDAAESARWKIDVTRPGTYEVRLAYGCEPEDAGSTFRLTAAGKQLDGTVQETPGKLIFRTCRLGAMSLPAGRTTLQIQPLKLAGKEFMSLHKIWFERVER